MRLRLLGSIRLGQGDHEVTLGMGKDRALLACLALSAPAPLPVETLAERLWDGDPPPGYRSTLHTYITRLRRTITRAGGDRDSLVHTPEGYLLRLPVQDTDWGLFSRLCSRARALTSTDARAARSCFEEALALWAGEPIPEVTGRWAERTRLTLYQAHQDALDSWAHLAARHDDHAHVVRVLGPVLALYPSDEVLHGHHMRALHRLGRTTDALVLYHRLKEHLAEQLGVDPSGETRRLFTSLLASTGAGSESEPDRHDTAVGAPMRSVRDNLPRDPAHFHGRETEAFLLISRLGDRLAAPTMTTWVLSGMPGIGKTMLALHVANRLKDAFPHTRLYLDLRGHHDRLEPLSVDEALVDLLLLARFPADRIPRTRSERIAVWREHTRTMRALIVLDDAADTEQVLPLLPAGEHCAALITTRRRLPDLEGAEHLPLRLPTAAECTMIFSAALGRDPTEDESDTVQEIIDRCGRLPLLVRSAATTTRLNLTWSLADLLHSLPAPDTPTTSPFRLGIVDLNGLFATTLNALAPDHRQAFLLLGLHPTRTVSEPIAAALIGQQHANAAGVLAALADAHLVDEPRPGRFVMHPLVGAYAHRAALTHLASRFIDSARSRMYTAYLDTVRRADRAVYPHRSGRDDHENTLRIEPWDETRALEWLRDEGAALSVILREARTHGHEDVSDALTHALSGHIDAHGPWHQAPALYSRLTRGGADDANPRARARAHFDRARALLRLRRTKQAMEENEAAHRLWTELGDELGTAWTVAQEGMILYAANSYAEGRRRFDQALERFEARAHRPGIIFSLRGRGLCHFTLSAFHEAIGDLTDATTVLEQSLPDPQLLMETRLNLAGAYLHLGYHHQAWALCERALTTARQRGDDHKAAMAWGNMSEVALYRGHTEHAIHHLRQVVEIFGAFQDRWALATALSNLGSAEKTAGDLEQARSYFRRSLSFARYLSPSTEVAALIGLAQTEEPDTSMPHRALGRAIEVAQRHGLRKEKAQAHYALGAVLSTEGEESMAFIHLEHAARIYAQLRSPESAVIDTVIETLKGKTG